MFGEALQAARLDQGGSSSSSAPVSPRDGLVDRQDAYPWFGYFRQGSPDTAHIWLAAPLLSNDSGAVPSFAVSSHRVGRDVGSDVQKESTTWCPNGAPPPEPLDVAALSECPPHPDAELLDLLGGPAQLTATGFALLARLVPSSDWPHNRLFTVLANCHCLLGIDDSWESIKTSLRAMGTFLLRLRYLEQSSISPERLEPVQRRFKELPAAFSPEALGPVSGVAAVLCAWVNAVCKRAGAF